MEDTACDKVAVLPPRYDQGTAVGRFRHFLNLTDPRCLSPEFFFGMSLDDARSTLVRFKGNPIPKEDIPERTWLASKIYTAAIHPDTGDTIPQPFRMSGFAIYGTPIVVGMLLPNPAGNLVQTMFWQSLNQTHNACVNYANRNASSPTPMTSLVGGYLGAVITSCTIATGLTQGLKALSLSQATKMALSRFVAYPAVASANIANLVMMRHTELTTGIHIVDGAGDVRGNSQVAAKAAIFDTAVTRVVLPMPLLLLPASFMNVLESYTPLFKRFPKLRLPVNAVACVGAFLIGLPVAISLFPQEGTIAAAELEPEFRDLKDRNGNTVAKFTYNKGL
eukprot:m.1644070 g.1644070  ORF g.1644070 m.1644070 type:complete len:335 (-) comp61098_c0_seq1:60-1064(-)